MEEALSKPFNVPVSLFWDYALNLTAGETRDRQGHAWEVGVKIGKKPKKFGDWRTLYSFRKMGKNAFPNEFPDADMLSGTGDGFGHEVIFSFGLLKNVWLEFDYMAYREKTMGTDPNNKWTYMFQSDINVKF